VRAVILEESKVENGEGMKDGYMDIRIWNSVEDEGKRMK
jgi:hypothetical protein